MDIPPRHEHGEIRQPLPTRRYRHLRLSHILLRTTTMATRRIRTHTQPGRTRIPHQPTLLGPTPEKNLLRLIHPHPTRRQSHRRIRISIRRTDEPLHHTPSPRHIPRLTIPRRHRQLILHRHPRLRPSRPHGHHRQIPLPSATPLPTRHQPPHSQQTTITPLHTPSRQCSGSPSP